MADSQPVKTEKESRAKLHFLRKIEQECQDQWEKDKIFEYDAPANGDNTKDAKYLVTFPFPYMNGRLHLGHSFSLTKAEFASSFHRLQGKNSLFPFGFHCTGMPIKACADKLKREIELFGNPPKFPTPPIEPEELPEKGGPEVPVASSSADPTAFHSKKSKVAAKAGPAKYQWEIMQSLGVPDEEIAKFADAEFWLTYFPPACTQDLKQMGCGIDWRRSFITTDVNPYFDSFVRWQFEVLKDLNKVLFGKRYSIYSPKDGQPCMDHDRQSGEGVLPQEYTLIKQQLVEPFPEKLQSLTGKKVFLVPGTLRPETMYGQTNTWILPDGEYGAFEVNDTDVFICTERSARNMAYQGLTKEHGKVSCLAKIKGWDLIGAAVKAPLAKYPVVYVLPMMTISMTKGTGIVTSVPSDSPDDYTCFEELRNKPAFRQKFNLDDKTIMPFEIVDIIEIPGLGTCAAAAVCKELKINGPKDPKLAVAKEQTYTKGFYEGKMIVGEHTGKLVKDAKPLIKDQLIGTGEAVIYSEPADVVMSRSGEECVVSLTDQWYLDYGEEKWRAKVEEFMKSMEFYASETKNKFEATLGWLNQWACSRTYGLGSKLPWDKQYLIESLSDSTIYMAYYTVAHLLQGGVVDGSAVGPMGIKAEQLTRDVWDFVCLKGKLPENTQISKENLEKLRNEFEYWYPVDMRTSGKDLITNHLTFFLYNHAAMWEDPKYFPKSVRANGHVLLDGNKMSKSTGNFLTLYEALEKYSVDGCRFALADAGDSLDDANFSTKVADNAVLKIYTQIKWTEEILAQKDELRKDGTLFGDQVFESEINKIITETQQHYEKTNFREALQSGFFALQTAKDNYKTATLEKGMKQDLVMKFLEVQAVLMAPITPHWSEWTWKALGKTGSVRRAQWPVAGPVDHVILQQKDYLYAILHEFRIKKDLYMRPKKKGSTEVIPAPTKAVIEVAATFVEWKKRVRELLKPLLAAGVFDDREILKNLTNDAEIKKVVKKAMPFVGSTKEQYKLIGESALDDKLAFNEIEFLKSNFEFIKKQIDVADLQIESASEDSIAKEKSSPGEPSIIYS